MQEGGPIGVYGLSLGGYNTALLACLEDLACAILGIPATDFTGLTWRHGAPLQIREHRFRYATPSIGDLPPTESVKC
jgi:hypothetical protein